MKIKKVNFNNKKKTIEIETRKGVLSLPFSKLDLVPLKKDKIKDAYVDPELGNQAITYVLESGKEDSVHLDVFLDYNKDPDYLRVLFLFRLTIEAQKALRESRLSKNEICRRLGTSPSQLSRLLDQTNQKKSVDKMLTLLAVLGLSVKPTFEQVA